MLKKSPMLSGKGATMLNNFLETSKLFDCKTPYVKELFVSSEYPWEIIPKIKSYIKELVEKGMEGYERIADGVLAGKNVKIYPTAVIEGYAIIGEGSVIRTGAFLRGNVIIGRGCVVGNSTEIKNSILLDSTEAAHYNYIGDSILGNKAHLGAGVICSNLKADGKNVVIRADKNYETNLRKTGAFLGDGADIGCGCVLNPGTVVGKNTSVYPLVSLRGVFPPDCIVKNAENIIERR